MPIWLIILLTFAIVMIALSVILYLIQDNIIFHAEKLPANFNFSFKNNFEEINLTTQDGNTLNGIIFKVENSKGIVLFYHNHSGNIDHWSRSAIFINSYGLDVLIMDYRGYGKSTGTFNEKLMLNDSLLWYDFTKKLYDEDKITVYGRGIGSTFATYVASKNNPIKLVLESAIYSLVHTANIQYPYLPNNLILKYKFDTFNYIGQVKCKIYLLHGKKDELVHYSNSEKLHQLKLDDCDLILMPEGNHHNLIGNEIYLKSIKEILSS
ncbi:MAG: alpha/beta hydrolase [Flavobacteriaceae bacterium]|nr:alpha/beta hydrolase [Flavobacteriaceae bacterium]